MATPSSTLALATLPHELLGRICEFLDQSSLKNCRLVNHSVEAAASEALFSAIHITTTIDSFNHATSIGRAAKYSETVRMITYHASGLIPTFQGSSFDPDWLTDTLFLEEPRLRAQQAWPLPPDIDKTKISRDCNAIWRARRELESHGYVSQRLWTLLQFFPNLTAIHLIPVLPESAYIPGEHIPFVGQVDEDAFTDVLAACHDQKRIKCLTARSLYWASFRACNDLRPLCGGLIELRLAVNDTYIGFPYSYMREEFRAFLKACTSLRAFTFEPSTKVNLARRGRCEIKTACEAVLDMVWSSLERLKLTNFLASRSGVERLLVNHATTLQSVQLEALQILEPPAADLAQGTAEGLYSTLARLPQLERVQVDGCCWQQSPADNHGPAILDFLDPLYYHEVKDGGNILGKGAMYEGKGARQ